MILQWYNSQSDQLPAAITVDCKAVRSTLDEDNRGLHIVNAVPHDDNLFSQATIQDKGNEDEGVRNLIATTPNPAGMVITNCQGDKYQQLNYSVPSVRHLLADVGHYNSCLHDGKWHTLRWIPDSAGTGLWFREYKHWCDRNNYRLKKKAILSKLLKECSERKRWKANRGNPLPGSPPG